MKTAERKTGEISREKILRAAEDYFQNRWGVRLPVSEVRESKTIPGCCHVFPEVSDDRLPRLLRVQYYGQSGISAVIPYYAVVEHPDRQMVSYFLGKGRCNLAEIAEVEAGLWSRSCGSYRLEELPHQDEERSKIGLWVHDCLTEDLDHGKALNRRNLPNGVCISYDFGMAFSSRYYPPFYTFELGLSDDSIRKHGSFVLSLLCGYAELLQTGEDKIVGILLKAYPETHNEPLGRYYLRNFKANFPVRLHYGQLIAKLKGLPFEQKKLRGVAEAVGIPMNSMDSWEDFAETLSAMKSARLDLRGLNLSGADLRKACLRGADLRDTDLSGADLAGADLRDTDLRGSSFDPEKIRQAGIDGAIF